MQRFRGGLVFKAHRLCASLNSRLERRSKEKEEGRGGRRAGQTGVPLPSVLSPGTNDSGTNLIHQHGRGAARAEDAQGTTQRHISPSILAYEDSTHNLARNSGQK